MELNPMFLMMSGSALTKLALAVGGSLLLAGPLNTPHTLVVGKSVYTPKKAQTLFSYTNANDWKKASQKSVGAVLDLERWSFTPESQQAHPVQAYKYFYQHLYTQPGQHFIVAAPSLDLVKSVVPDYSGKLDPEFVQLKLAEKIAPYSNFYEIQAQALENNPKKYKNLVKEIVQQVKISNPGAVVIAGISTNPSGRNIPVLDMIKDVKETRHLVSGYWLTIPETSKSCPSCGDAQPKKAVELLKAIS